ncbi:hypothetical protein GX50_07525 [[Emmonsia] crescens]|uniref:HNH nuclease domain-containing protein n=1 Tax=[Emmonsia] crescens TaxID=73230 RepID=A0A2B7Z8L9_9EURO|nr:hypothetical protein GX50_07525 [Emmonsia crescens]
MFLQQVFTYFDQDQRPPTFEHGLLKFSSFSSQTIPLENRDAEEAIDSFAEYLFDNFFLPMKTAETKMPQSTSASLSASSIENVIETSSEFKKTALLILNMFNPGVIHLIEDLNIDHVSNALILTTEAHAYFDNFQIYFEAMNDNLTDLKHTYKIHSSDCEVSLYFKLSAMRTLLLSSNHTIDSSSSKLLALHQAIAIILDLSAAEEYIDQIIHDSEQL